MNEAFKNLKIGVVGSGVVGGVISAMLAKAGFDVELARIYNSQIKLTNNVAIEVVGEFGKHTVLVPSCKGIENFSSQKDYIFIVPRAYDVKKSVLLAKRFLTQNGKIVTMQNVLTIDDVLNVIPKEKVLGLILGWASEKISPSKMKVVTKGNNIIGAFCADMEPYLLELKEILNYVTSTYIIKNFMGLAISRLIINSCISSLGCITGLRLGCLMQEKKVKRLFSKMFKEDMMVAKSKGIYIEPYCREFDYYKIMESGIFAYFYRNQKLSLLGKQNPYIVSSILRSVEKNKKSEIEYLNGYFVKEAKRFNIKTPINSRVMEMVTDIENHEIGIFPDNLKDFYLRNPRKYVEKEINYVN